MPTMVTFRTGRLVLIAILAGLAAGCSREQQDWRSAEGADTSEAWAVFIEQHPDSELVPEARARIAQLAEERDWQHATSIATADAYRAFVAAHPRGKLSEQARIRIEAFALGSAPRIAPQTPAEAAAAPATGGVRALELVTAAAPSSPPAAADTTVAQPMLAAPGEAAEPPPPPHDTAGEVAQPLPAAAETTGGPAQPLPAVAETAAGSAQPMPASAETAGEPAQPLPVARDPTGGFAQGGYGVQLGAFGSEASAGREWQRLQERFGAQLGGLSPRIVLASSNSGQFYRLQAAAAGEAQARAICDSLREQAQACVPVLPR
jgi:SPOR domain